MFIDATQITAAQRNAVAVEEFQNLDCDLASIVEPIAELRGGELAVRRPRREIDGDVHHFPDDAAQEKVIMRDLVDFAQAAEQLERLPHLGASILILPITRAAAALPSASLLAPTIDAPPVASKVGGQTWRLQPDMVVGWEKPPLMLNVSSRLGFALPVGPSVGRRIGFSERRRDDAS